MMVTYRFRTLLAAGLAWFLSMSAMAGIDTKPSDLLPFNPYSARYVVKWHGIKGGESLHRLVRRDDGIYAVESITEPYLKVLPFRYVEKTSFRYSDGKIIPRLYMYDMKEGRRVKNGNVFFDWQENLVFKKGNKDPWSQTITEELSSIQDKLTHAVKLRLDLMEDATPRTLTYTVAEDDEIKPYVFKIEGQEVLNTAIGRINALRVLHTTKKERFTLMWLSMDHDYLPIKVEHYREGSKVGSGEIKSYQPNA